MELAMVDDVIVPIAEAQISAHDRSVYFGDGVYEAVRYCNGKLFAIDWHIDRLTNSLRKMDMLDKVDLELVRRRVDRALAQADIAEAVVYFQITRGRALRSHDYDDDWQPGFLLTVRQFTRQADRATAVTHPDWRWKRCDIKSLNLLANVLAKHAAVKAGAYDAILVDENGLVTEATSSSVLMVKDGVLLTAPLTANILPGITRALVLEWADKVGLQRCEESFTVGEALAADELMAAGTATEVMGITQLNGKKIADGKPGSFTRRFRELLIETMEEGETK